MRFQLGQGTRNALLNRSMSDAAYRQSQTEHNGAINKFVTPGMNPVQRMAALKQGEAYEQSLPKYWNDNTPRRPLNPSSSFIEQVEYYPGLGMTRIQIGGKSYIDPMDARRTGDMVTADSVGGYYNRHVKLK